MTLKTKADKEVYYEIDNIEFITHYKYRLEYKLQHFIEWLEANKEAITDKKIFGGDKEITDQSQPTITIIVGGDNG